jgi:hypothetical protein
MRTTLKGIAGLTAACMVCGAPAALAATKKPKRPAGTSYVATTAAGGVQIVVSANQRQVKQALFAYKAACTDGDTDFDYDQYVKLPINAQRKFSYSYTSGTQASTTVPGATFSYTQAFSGTMNKLGTKIVGTARATYTFANPATGVSYSCDTGAVPFNAVD